MVSPRDFNRVSRPRRVSQAEQVQHLAFIRLLIQSGTGGLVDTSVDDGVFQIIGRAKQGCDVKARIGVLDMVALSIKNGGCVAARGICEKLGIPYRCN